jgi:hypothetical protein
MRRWHSYEGTAWSSSRPRVLAGHRQAGKWVPAEILEEAERLSTQEAEAIMGDFIGKPSPSR